MKIKNKHKFIQKVGRIWQYLSKNAFFKAVAKLSGATFIGQVVSILTSLILTRLYTPADFGILSIFTAIAGQLSVFISLRYEWAILPAKEEGKAADVAFLSFFIAIFVTIITVVITIFNAEQIATLVKVPDLAKFLWLMPLTVFLTGIYQILNYWALRQKEFSLIGKSQIDKSLWSNGIQISLGFFHIGALGLLLGYLVNQFAGVRSLLSLFWKTGQTYLSRSSLTQLVSVGKEYSILAASCVSSSFFNGAGISAPSILLALYYDPETVGMFALAQRLISIPSVLICNSISQVYASDACRLIHENPSELKKIHTKTTLLLFGVSILAGLFLLFSPWIVPLVFGSKWLSTGTMAQYLIPCLISSVAVSPLTMLEWMNKNVEIFIWHLFRLLFLIMGFYFAHTYNLSSEMAVAVFSGVTAIMYAILFILNRMAINNLIAKHARTII
jgi:O-antigen/teichoic acid export membrane protein